LTDKTPTPVDPEDRPALYNAFRTARSGAGDYLDGIRAVARAVLPEGYVAVPVAEIRQWAEYLSVFEWDGKSDDLFMWMSNLLPEAGEE
jgi:hypothetical protein